MIVDEELDKLKNSLLSTVSHELRSPLTTIKGYATMLLDYEQKLNPEEKREYLKSINRATDRLTELVDHLLDLSRLETGLLKLNKEPSDITDILIEEVTEARFRAPSYEIKLKMADDLPKVEVDPGRIRQVIDNLLDNAIKYSEKGTSILVEARCASQELHISVSDQGIGIPAKDLNKVFSWMYRIERPVSEVSGIGLGLAICKGLIQAHGGKLWVESEPGKGSTFHFILPIETSTKGRTHDIC